jgi:hypothetical protein
MTVAASAPAVGLGSLTQPTLATLIEIRIGSLDEAPFELKPESEIWVKRRESWIPPVEGAAQHDESAAQHDES